MTTGTLPNPKAPHMQALDTANDRRLSRAALRGELRRAELTLREALDDPRAQTSNIWKLIGHLPRWGSHKVNELSLKLIRQRVMIGYGARVGSLTDRQRDALLEAVEKPYKRTRTPKRRPSPAPNPPRLDDPPERCLRCKCRLLDASGTGHCGFCEVELSSVDRALEGRT